MYKQCVLPLLALYVGIARSTSWDIVVGRNNRLEFYKNGIFNTLVKPSTAIAVEWLSYDPNLNRLLIFDKKSTVVSFDLSTKEIQTLIEKKKKISSIAYDPENGLFVGIIDKIIYSFRLKSGKDDIDENLVIDLQKDNSEPRDIAVDSSCGGYIFWTTASVSNVIEKVRFNGFGREVVIGSSDKVRNALAIDPQTKKMYWIEHKKGVKKNRFSIISADLNGENMISLYNSEEVAKNFEPNQLSVSKDFIYWGNRIRKYFWQLPSNSKRDTKVTTVTMDRTNYKYGFHGIAANYKIEKSDQAIPNCKPRNSLQSDPAKSDSEPINVPKDVSLVCVHGTKVRGDSRCECIKGYSGERCDVSACQNYCFQGDCKISTEGQPKCRCNAGYSGARCERKACQGHCLKTGICSLGEDNEPMCQCTGNYVGDRYKGTKPVIECKGEKPTSASRLPRMTVTWKTGATPK